MKPPPPCLSRLVASSVDHDVGPADAVARQPDLARLGADEPAGFGHLAAIGDGGEHLISNAPGSPWCLALASI